MCIKWPDSSSCDLVKGPSAQWCDVETGPYKSYNVTETFGESRDWSLWRSWGNCFFLLWFFLYLDWDWLIMNLLRQSVGMFQTTHLKHEDLAYNWTRYYQLPTSSFVSRKMHFLSQYVYLWGINPLNFRWVDFLPLKGFPNGCESHVETVMGNIKRSPATNHAQFPHGINAAE